MTNQLVLINELGLARIRSRSSPRLPGRLVGDDATVCFGVLLLRRDDGHAQLVDARLAGVGYVRHRWYGRDDLHITG